MSNRNSIIGFLLIFAILIGYYLITAPSKEELAERQHKMDSIARVQRIQDSIALANQLAKDTITKPEQKEVETAQPASEPAPATVDLREKYGVFALASQGEEKIYYVENDLLKMGVSSKGGRVVYVELKDYKTWDSLPLILLDADTSVFGYTFFANNRAIHTSDFYFEPFWPEGSERDQDTLKATGTGYAQLGMRLYASSDTALDRDKYIEYLYTVTGNKYMVDFNVTFHGFDGTIDATRGFLDFEWGADLRKQERSVDRFNGSTIYYKIIGEKVHYMSESKDDEESLKDKIKWVSFKQQFFSSTLIAGNFFVDPIMRVYTEATAPSSRYLKSVYFKVGMPYSGLPEEAIPMSFYFGPNKYNVMRKYKLDLERQIPLGWSFFLLQWINRYAVLPVFNFLGSFGWNYGIVILILTILLKTVLLPVAYKTYMSSAKMRVLKPEIDEINKKFPKKDDAMKKQQATMALYKKAGVNPMAGCIPMLLQMPILIAMFRFFPASIELRQASFLWAHDLSSYDSILQLPFTIPFYGDHVSLFTLLMTISTVIYTYMNNQLMGSTSQQMPGMKTMMYVMPVMFLPLFNNYSSGLSYYYFLVNIFTFLQMFLFRYFVDEEKIHKRIEANKNKPVKKSAFQKRLEDAAKQRGYRSSKR